MAQTKKRRRTKHRGNAAGMVESRGRTGRRPDEKEKGAGIKQDAAARRRSRLESPPTWRSAFNRAGIAAAVFAVLMATILRRSIGVAVAFSAVMLTLYVPL